MQIAIIGAGLAGLTCASRLQAKGHAVVVYEKNAEVSGRMSTWQNELGGFDLGAQYFTVTSDAFSKEATHWRKKGWIAPWKGRLVKLDKGIANSAESPSRSLQRMVAVPGMASLCQQLARELDVRTEHAVGRIEPYGKQWLLSVLADTVPIAASAGPFDAVIVAVPADQAAALLKIAPKLAGQVQKASLAPCWALMLGFQESLGLRYDGAWVQQSRLAWIARDTSKPQRRPGEHWIGHASAAWSVEHLADDPERAKEKLLKAFHEATGSQVQPVHASVHRWRYAQAATPLPGNCLWDGGLRIGACGDWFSAGLQGGGRIENAWLSGLAAAAAIK